MNMPQSFPSRTVIYLSFAATGVGMALPGAVLPALLAHWSLADGQAGLLFFLGWMGTSLGALMVRPSRTRSLAFGGLLAGVGAVGMAFSTRTGSFIAMTVYGVGLGMVMTATSLIQSARHAESRGAELNRLNLIWALGASSCPTLAEHSLRVASARMIFSALGAFFLCVALWALVVEREPERGLQPKRTAMNWRTGWQLSMWPVPLVAIMMLPTGIEASMGAWIAAYVLRTQHTITTTVTAGTFFWIGLMLSRTIVSTVKRLHHAERLVLNVSLGMVVVGALVLIASSASGIILPGIFLIGFGLGPVYPLLLAIALQYSENTAIFFIAGLGSAVYPWLTGVVSSAASSLRIGLLVPLLASVLMLVLGVGISTNRRKVELASAAN